MNKDFVFEGLNYKQIKKMTYKFVHKNWNHTIEYLEEIDYRFKGFENDKKKAMILLHFYGSIIKFLNDELCDDEDIVLMAIKSFSYALNFASERLKDDYNICIESFKGKDNFIYISKRLRRNKNICYTAIKANPFNIRVMNYDFEFFRECLLMSLKKMCIEYPVFGICDFDATTFENKKIVEISNIKDGEKFSLIYLPKDLYEEIKHYENTIQVIKHLEKSIEIKNRKTINNFYDVYIY